VKATDQPGVSGRQARSVNVGGGRSAWWWVTGGTGGIFNVKTSTPASSTGGYLKYEEYDDERQHQLSISINMSGVSWR